MTTPLLTTKLYIPPARQNKARKIKVLFLIFVV